MAVKVLSAVHKCVRLVVISATHLIIGSDRRMSATVIPTTVTVVPTTVTEASCDRHGVRR
jgi:hypothetical protein